MNSEEMLASIEAYRAETGERGGESPAAGLAGVPSEVGDNSEDSLALWFAQAHNDVLYMHDRSAWFHWNGRVWVRDQTAKVYERVRTMVRIASSAGKKAETLKRAAVIAAVEKMARSDQRLAAVSTEFDVDPWLLNTLGGVVNLRTGKIIKHSLTDRFTKIVEASPGGECPRWMLFLEEVTDNDPDLIAFLQRMVGYSLTGSIREHALFFLYGTGRNGKGVFLNTLLRLLGEYAKSANMDMLTEAVGDRHPQELAALVGKRLVIAQEVDEGRKWAEARIKQLTGGDPITARFMRMDEFTFDPQFKLIIAGNHKPTLRNVDEAIRSRLHLIPFTVTIAKDKRDPDLEVKLSEEWGGILQWAIDGAALYQEQGLTPPEAVTRATGSYFEDQDVFAQWVEDRCEVGSGYWENPSALFRSWESYAKAMNIRVGDNRTLKDRLESAGFPHGRSGPKGRFHAGLKLIQAQEQNDWRSGP